MWTKNKDHKLENTKYVFSEERLVKINLVVARERIEPLIGKGKAHATLNQIRAESGARISVNPCENMEDMCITISAIEVVESYSPTSSAAFSLFKICIDGDIRVRILINQRERQVLNDEFRAKWNDINSTPILVYEEDEIFVEINGQSQPVQATFKQVVLALRKVAFIVYD